MTSLLAATLGLSGGFAAGFEDSGGLCVALPCASAKRSRLHLEVYDDCEVNQSVFALNLLETGGIGLSESCYKVGYSILSIDLASWLHRMPPKLSTLSHC